MTDQQPHDENPDESLEPAGPSLLERFWAQAFPAIRETAFVLVSAVVLSIALRTFLFQMFYVPSGSMLDTLQIGDKIVASKITKTIRGIDRGDVVVFHDPGGWLYAPVPLEGWRGRLQSTLMFIGLLPSNTGEDLVKRVVGVAGDRVSCCSPQGEIKVNGIAVDESAYIIPPTNQVSFDIIVPADHVFVMGDNRGNSQDSRFHLESNSGAVPLDEVRGVVVAKLWPFDRIGGVPAPAALIDPKLDAAKAAK